jgi:protein tyrosine kinase modulator
VHSTDDLVAGDLGGFQLREYWNLACRRKWWIIISTTALFVATTVFSLRIPSFYRSETVILVDPQKVPDSYVQSTLSGGATDRLTTLRQLATSPTRLKGLIDRLGLYPELAQSRDPDRAIATMQANTHIDVADYGGQRPSAFKIAFTAADPRVAAVVANELAAMIIQDNLKSREQAVSGAEEFLDEELRDTKKQLEGKEAEVQQIKTQYILDLPESKQFHLESLNSLRNQLTASQDRVNQDKQQIIYLQSTANGAAPPTVDLDSGGSSSMSPYQTNIQKEETRLAELQARYGPQFPDVRKLQKTIADLKIKAAEDAQNQPVQAPADQVKLTQSALRHNPVIEAQITKLEQEIDEGTKRQAALEPQIASHISALEREPIFEQQISGFMRDYDTLRAHYNSLLDKKMSAEMALALETRQQGERFVVLDPAPVPYRPTGPNRPLFALAGLLGGFLGGFGLAVIIEMSDESVRSEREAAQILNAPVLVAVPCIYSPRERFQGYVLGATSIALTVVVSAAAGALLPYALRLLS